MILKELRITNFKSLQEPTTLEFSDLTFLYGPNSAGKSAVLDALALIQSICSSKLCLETIHALTNSKALQEKQGIKLGVTVFLEALSFEFIGSTQFNELERTYGVLKEGADLHFDIEFEGSPHCGKPVRQLTVGIDGEEIVKFTNDTTRLGPRLQLLTDNQIQPSPCKTILGLDGEWRLNAKHLLSDDIIIQPCKQSIRSNLAFSDDGEDTCIIRGISYSHVPEAPELFVSSPQISASSLQFILPPRPNDIISHPDNRSSLYRDPRILDRDPPDPKAREKYCHRTFLESYGWRARDIQAYPEFLQQEFSAENSTRLFTDLKEQRGRIFRFLSAVLTTIAESIDIPRVPGSRSAFDSRHPIHVKSHTDDWFSKEPFAASAVRTGEPLLVSSHYSPLYDSSSRLVSEVGETPTTILKLIAPYAMRVVNGLVDGEKTDAESNFPNFALGKYLHSLGKYRIATRIYHLTSDDMEEDEDPSDLAGSRIVYFHLKSETEDRLSFSDVGSSLGYIFPTLAALGDFTNLAVEQPELHLHPIAQDQLADVFIHSANSQEAFPKRLIIESHSEIFLLRIAQRMADTYNRIHASGNNISSHSPQLDVTSDQVAIYYFFPESDGSTSVEKICFAANGALINTWPPGMFANDWTSGINRLKLFSQLYSLEEAISTWPWLSELGDPLIQEWLRISLKLESLGSDMLQNCVVIWGKVAEKVLKDEILEPIRITFRHSRHKLSDQERKLENGLFGDFLKKNRSPTLGWWSMTLDRVRNRREGEPDYVRILRSHLKKEQFQLFWVHDRASDLIDFIKVLREVRNPSAHAGNADPSKMVRARDLIARGNQPGILFVSLGLISKKRKRLDEVK